MADVTHTDSLSLSTGRTLCRLVRGIPGAADDAAFDDLLRLGLVSVVGAEECRDAARWETLAREAGDLRDSLLQMRAPGGVAALLPGAAARFRKRAADAQARLDALAEEARAVEQRFTAAQRALWPLLAASASRPDGGRAAITPEGYRAACAFWGSASALPSPDEMASGLAQAGETAAQTVQALADWWDLPPEEAWLSAAILSDGAGDRAGALRTLYEWLAQGKFWGQNPFSAAVILAGAPDPGAAARAAAALAELLRHMRFGVGAEVFTAACRLAARETWLAPEAQAAALELLARRWDEWGRAAQHQALPLLAPLACLPRPAADAGRGLQAVRETLYRQRPEGASTVEVAAVLLAGSGFYHAARHEGQALLDREDPAAQALTLRYRALHAPLMRMDAPARGPGNRVDVLAAAAALIPGPAEEVPGLLDAAREALAAVDAPSSVRSLPVCLALILGCCGSPLGVRPHHIALELLSAQTLASASTTGRGPGRGAAPDFRTPTL